MRIRQHVNPLRSEYLCIDVPKLLIEKDRRIEVELGSAEAHFLIDRAKEDPSQAYVGIEIRRELALQTQRLCEEKGIAQVRSIYANMSVDLPRLFSPGQVARFFINFPDPWWKGRQRKRRVVSEELLDELFPLLSAEGEVFVATDIFDIALDAMAVLERETPRKFVNLHAPWSFLPQSPFTARSRRERQCEDLGVRIWRLGYRRL